MKTGSNVERPRKRTCQDRWRYRRHRMRHIDPAASVALKLLLVILIMVGRAPSVPAWSPWKAATAIRTRDDWSREQEARECGEGGSSIMLPKLRPPRLHGRYRSSPSYRRLVADLRRPAAREEAKDILRHRLALPLEAQGWLEEIYQDQDWASLATCAQPGRLDADAEIAMLSCALIWMKERARDDVEDVSALPLRGDAPFQ